MYVVGKDAEVIHAGIDAKKLPESIDQLVLFLQQEHELDPLNKAVIAHYYIPYLHPWFDGNGRMAHMLHIWFYNKKDILPRCTIRYQNIFCILATNITEHFVPSRRIESISAYWILPPCFSIFPRRSMRRSHWNPMPWKGDFSLPVKEVR